MAAHAADARRPHPGDPAAYAPDRLEPAGPGGGVMRLAGLLLRYGLAVVFLWFGAMKFTAYEAAGIAPFVANSPVVGWWHALLGIDGTARMLGVVEIGTGLLLALGPVAPVAGIAGGLLATVTFLTTLTFFATTPGVAEPRAGGFPAISAEIGQFLLKDLVLLAASLWCLGHSLVERARRRAGLGRT